MGGLLSTLPVVFRRVAANWKLLAAVVVGAVLAAAIVSTTSIYTDAIRDLGLSYAIRQRGPDQINIVVKSTSQNSAGDVYQKNQGYIESQARRYFGSLIHGDVTQLSRSSTFYPTAPGAAVDPADSRPRSQLQFVTGIEPHINIVAGRLPNDAAPATPNAPPSIEAAVGSDTAKQMGISIGSEYDLHPFWVEDAQPVRVTIVGIIEPKDQSESFWLGQTDLFTFPTSNWQTMPLFITQNTFFNSIVGYLPTMISDFTNLIYLDTSGVNARNADRVKDALNGYSSDLQSNVLRTTTTTALPDVLATYDQKLFFTRIPLLVLVLQIAAIVMYYLYMVSTMLVERQASEIALLKSRGATTWQVMRIYMMEGFFISLAALVLGPPIAAGVIAMLGHTPPFHDLSGGASLRVHLGRDAWLWAAGGALLAYLTLLLPAYQATRRTVVQQRAASARPPKEPVFTRYYLDLALAVLGGILLYQLNRRGTLVNHKFFGDQSVDPVVLLTPAFFILTVGLVFLRLFPLVLKLLAWIVARAQGASILIGMWQLVRNPVHYSRLVLLLMLGTAVGMFAASFGATLNRSYADRASYQSGSDVRISDVRTVNSAGPNDAPGVIKQDVDGQQVSQVYRLEGSQGPIISRISLDVLGVDPQSFA
ncbi:MAG TPA: ABC transporter permease, partial [Nitrolancea sp.]|nr:ABC transporter permease [Nitrolancea sp.]